MGDLQLHPSRGLQSVDKVEAVLEEVVEEARHP
jgi:hypothetical protein